MVLEANKMLSYAVSSSTGLPITKPLQESFYKAQASVYDATRVQLLRGREDMLGLVAAQMKHRAEAGLISQRPVWVDVSSVHKERL